MSRHRIGLKDEETEEGKRAPSQAHARLIFDPRLHNVHNIVAHGVEDEIAN